MVNPNAETLDRTFAALADPTRRALLTRLEGEEGLTVSELAEPFTMSLPAVMKHLGVLEGAGLIEREKQGRSVTCRLTAGPMEDAMAWLERYRRFWETRLDRLAALVEAEEEEEKKAWSSGKQPAPAGKSRRGKRATSARRGRKRGPA